MANKPEPHEIGDAPITDTPHNSHTSALQQAVETFVKQHAEGETIDPITFAAGYPEVMRSEVVLQCREFLTFDGLLGHQTWRGPKQEPEDGRVFGDFLIQEELGRGGMGIVYLAKQRSLNRRVALKVMASGLTLSRRYVERFRREAMATAQLHHRAIVPVHSLTEVNGTFALSMDYIAGRNLADILDDLRLANSEDGVVDVGTLGIASDKGYVAECAMLVAEVASALAVAHQNQVVHRDLKPRNLMIDERRQIRLLDFGLAKSSDATRESLSMSGELTGTWHYMSPEQTLAKRAKVDHRADIWALGVILYELLTLNRPFDGKDQHEIVYEICFKEPVGLQRRNAKVPRDLVTICQKALEKDAAKRYQSASEFEQDLQRFLRWEPIQAKPASPWTRATKFIRRHRRESNLVAAALAISAVVIAYVWVNDAQDQAAVVALLERAEAHALEGDYALAIARTNEALVIRNDDSARERLERYHDDSKRVANEAAWKATRSQQLLEHDREGALRLALEAEDQMSTAVTRSAVLDALGKGWLVRTLPTTKRTLAGNWSPSGEHIAIAGYNGSLQFFRSGMDENPITLTGHNTKYPITGVAFAGEKRVISVGIDQTMRLWQPEQSNPPLTVQLAGQASTLDVSSDGLRALIATHISNTEASRRLTKGPYLAQVWSTVDGSPIAKPMDHKGMILGAAISADGMTVATVTSNYIPRLWRVADSTLIAECRGNNTRAVAAPKIAFAPDNSLCAIGHHDGSLQVYATQDGTLLATASHSKAITSIVFDNESQRILTGSRDETARLWQIKRNESSEQEQISIHEIGILLGHSGAVNQVAFGPHGQLAATADSAISIFDVGTDRAPGGRHIYRYEVGRPVEQITFADDGRRILGLAGTRSLVWDFSTARGVVTLRQPGIVPAFAFLDNDRRIVTAGDDERLRMWHTRDGRQAWISDPCGMPLLALDIDPQDRLIACSDVSGHVHVMLASNGKQQFTLDGHKGKVPVVRFCGEAQLLTAGANPQTPETGRAIIWDLANQKPRRTLDRAQPIRSADINHDGTMLITVEGEERFARLWSLPDLKEQRQIGDHTDICRQATFSPDGKRVLTASNDQTARIYRLDGKQVGVISTNAKVKCAQFSSDARFILTCKDSLSGAAQLWRVTDGTEVVHFDGHRDKLSWGTFNTAGTWAATAARDGTTCIWPTDPIAVAKRLPSHVPSSTSPK
jgi:serine/threonine protein kinase/WD40 repeat protein